MALHALAVSRYLSSAFFLISFLCWLFVGGAALLRRPDTIKAMTMTMIASLALAAVVVGATSHLEVEKEVDKRAFFLLGLFPSLTAWACVRFYVLHLERARVDVISPLGEWFDERGRWSTERGERLDTLAERFSEEMMSSVDHSNDPHLSVVGRRRMRAAG